MKNKLSYRMLLLATLAATISGCGEANTSQPETVSPSYLVEPTNQQSEETSSNESGIIIDNEVRVVLNRNIYVENETKNGTELDIAKVEVYSAKLGGYKPKTNYEVKMPDKAPNGEAYARVTIGTKITDVKFYYYEDAKKAAELTQINIPENASDYFKETKYIKNGKLKFDAYEEEGVLYGESDYTSQTPVYVEYVNRKPDGLVYNAQRIEYHSYDKTTTEATLDNTKKTIDHLQVKVPEYDELGNIKTDDENNIIYTDQIKTLTCGTYEPAGYSATFGFEFITDADGKILYIGRAFYKERDQIDLASGKKYWAREKDYTKNPIFVLANDYDATNNPYAYEKVFAEGGNWIIGYNNYGTAQLGDIDMIFKTVTGSDNAICKVYNDLTVTLDDEQQEQLLLDSRLKYDSSSRALRIYLPANTYQKYAYYYSLALKNNNAEQLAAREEIYNALVKQKLPEVQAEPVLVDYYTSVTTELLDKWIATFSQQ